MFVSSRALFPVRLCFRVSVLAFFGLALAVCRPASAQLTRLWTQSHIDDFEKGTPEGVAITSDGHLREGPGLTELLTTPSTFVWSVAVDKNGLAYLGAGSPATVLRVAEKPGSKPFTLFETKDVSVQAVCVGPDGWVYAATMPSGKVYRLNADATAKLDESTATVIFDASKLDASTADDGKTPIEKPANKPHYIWDLTFDPQGRLYIATGDPGAVYRVDPAHPGAQPEQFFKSDEAHIRSLAWDGKGNLLAGTDGSGLVYRINPQGKGYVLFEAPEREVTALAVGEDGTIYAACVGEKGHNPLPPLPVQGAGTVTITIVQPASMQAVNASTSVPEGTEIFALTPNQAPRKLWADKDDVVYGLARQPDGLLAITGNRGHIVRIQDDGSYADVGHLSAQQGLSLAPIPGSQEVLIGAGNTGRLYLLGATASHEYASDVLDAGALSRFGLVEIEPGSAAYELFTRTGNIEQPVRGWTDWQPLTDGSVASPAGRFLQWKAVLRAGGVLGSVGVNYLPVDTAPVVDDLVVVPGARLNPQNQISQPQTVNISFPSSDQGSVSYDASSSTIQAVKDRTAITVRWAAHDDDGDKLIYALYLRGDGETVWRLLKDKITDTAYSFDATLVPDGGYQIKVVASNAPSQTPGTALTGDKISDRFVIDTTPPAISALHATDETGACQAPACPATFHVEFDAEDNVSPIAHAEYSLDAGPWQFVAPVGTLSDSRHEHYDFRISLPAAPGQPLEHLITVRAYDRYDNVGVAKTVMRAQPK